MKSINFYKIIMVAMLLFWLQPALAGDDVEGSISELQHGWARALYQTPQDRLDAGYRELATRAAQVTARYPGEVEAMVWEAIVLSSYAEFQNGLGALGKLKKAKALLLAAEELNATAMSGTIPMVLGVIHYKAPGWPLSFGDQRKAREYLQAALRINPDGIDQNFYYGEFLLQQRDLDNAASYLNKALRAAPRAGREDADLGRRAEIERMLQAIAQQ